MIQRIQSVYLLLIAILTSFTLFLPSASLINKTGALNYIVNYKGVFLLQNSGPVFVQNVFSLSALTILILFVTILTIFLYKKRMLQIRLLFFNIVLMLGYYAILFIYLWQLGEKLNAEWILKMVTAFPLINVILSVLAIRAIGKDAALIKSLNRLR